MKRVVTGVSGLLFAFSPAVPHAAAQGSVAAVGGVVRDLHGTPQMGALVELLSPDATVVAQTYTDDHGRYALGAISPGRYQLRASGAFLLPLLRPNLLLNPGMRALANLSITAMVEVGAWFPVGKRGADEPYDDWRWNLRSTANRPLLRLDDEATQASAAIEQGSDHSTKAQVAVLTSAGEFARGGTHEMLTLERAQADGRTEIFHTDLGQSAEFGVASSRSASSIGFEAGLDRKTALGGETRLVAGFSSHPELTIGGEGGLQAFTLASSEKMAIGDAVLIDAGTLLSAERLVQSRVSTAPFLRIVVTPATGLAVMYRYASTRALQSTDDLDRVQTAAETLSDGQGRPIALRSAHQELSVAHRLGADTETISVYQDGFAATSIAGVALAGYKNSGSLPMVSDLGSNTFRFAAKGYTAHGVSVSWTHQVSTEMAASLAVELGSVLERDGNPLVLSSLDSSLQVRTEPSIRAAIQGNLAHRGTKYWLQYRWQPEATLDTVDNFNNAAEQAYLSCSLRQRLWSGHRLRGIDAVLEASNLLEEGYQPTVGPDGQMLLLAQAPRSLQAGLSFKF